MSRKLIAVIAAAALVAVGAVGSIVVSSSFGTEQPGPAHYSSVQVDLSKSGHAADAKRKPALGGHSSHKPKLVYLVGTPLTLNPADVSAGGLGPYIDLTITGCSKVVDGGVTIKDSSDVYVQGSYVQSPGEYHVRIGLDDAAVAANPRLTFTVVSNLTCLKGAK